ncbi:MAG: helix-turn-helix domain-containing protein [Chloroflexi bacterium]|nr:helix-turn-helix domain-containing protein [Chloroflexota bacterium]
MDKQKSMAITIKEASRTLGVSEVALRKWTDEGKIRAFITPGGHRRYSREELKKFMNSGQKLPGLKDLAVELEEAVRLSQQIAQSTVTTASWYKKLSEESQEHLAYLAENFIKLAIRYITEPAKRPETIRLACEVSYDFGQTLAELGLPLTDAVQAFVWHRSPFMDGAIQLLRKRETSSGRILQLVPLATSMLDETLVSLAAAFEQHMPGNRRELTETVAR